MSIIQILSGHKFQKSYLLDNSMLYEIENAKSKLKHKVISHKLTGSLLSILSKEFFCFFNPKRKLNIFYGIKKSGYQSKESEKKSNYFYTNLDYDKEKLKEYCNDDNLKYEFLKKKLQRLSNSPKFVKGRYYHVFHEFSGNERETFLTLDGMPIKEVFDIHGSDLHMLAKLLEKENIPADELKKFQKDVKNDIRKHFGVNKSTGKCYKVVKTAFKIFLNSKDKENFEFRSGSYCDKISKYFLENYPTIWKWIKDHDKIWEMTTNEEFEIMSKKLVEKLYYEYGIKSLTCHDAIYSNIDIDNIEDIFYDVLNFSA